MNHIPIWISSIETYTDIVLIAGFLVVSAVTNYVVVQMYIPPSDFPEYCPIIHELAISTSTTLLSMEVLAWVCCCETIWLIFCWLFILSWSFILVELILWTKTSIIHTYLLIVSNISNRVKVEIFTQEGNSSLVSNLIHTFFEILLTNLTKSCLKGAKSIFHFFYRFWQISATRE